MQNTTKLVHFFSVQKCPAPKSPAPKCVELAAVVHLMCCLSVDVTFIAGYLYAGKMVNTTAPITDFYGCTIIVSLGSYFATS